MSSNANRVFGIDLGTTYSCIAQIEDGNVSLIKNLMGEDLTPSVVQFDGTERIVGTEAKNSIALYPKTTIEVIKRDMGNPDYIFEYEGAQYTPELISAEILRKVVADAEQAIDQKITDVVITCPAYFGIPEREATVNAGKAAGLNVRSILDEPTAAAMAYGVDREGDQTILVYDLGGGTFDISVITIKDGNIAVICTDGDRFLGGRDWDDSVSLYLASEWQLQTNSSEDPLSTFESIEEIRQTAERAKRALSIPGRDKTTVPVMFNNQRVSVILTLEKFDEITEPLLWRTIERTRDALNAAAQKGVTNFSQILLVGGSVRMLQVAKRLQAELNMTTRIYEPDEAVAKGAAIFGQKLLIDEEIEEQLASGMNLDQAQRTVAQKLGLQLPAVKKQNQIQIQTVSTRSFGVIAWNPAENREVVSNLIRKNDPIPATVKQRFGTKEAGQDTILIRIVDNLSPDRYYEPEKSRLIDEAKIMLSSGLPVNAPIEITFELSAQGRLYMIAREMTGGHEFEIEFRTDNLQMD